MEYSKERKQITISQNTGITVSVALLVMFSGAIYTVATWASNTNNLASQNTRDISTLQSEVSELKAQNQSSQVKFAEIQTQLRSIDANILEIKESVQGR